MPSVILLDTVLYLFQIKIEGLHLLKLSYDKINQSGAQESVIYRQALMKIKLLPLAPLLQMLRDSGITDLLVAVPSQLQSLTRPGLAQCLLKSLLILLQSLAKRLHKVIFEIVHAHPGSIGVGMESEIETDHIIRLFTLGMKLDPQMIVVDSFIGGKADIPVNTADGPGDPGADFHVGVYSQHIRSEFCDQGLELGHEYLIIYLAMAVKPLRIILQMVFRDESETIFAKSAKRHILPLIRYSNLMKNPPIVNEYILINFVLGATLKYEWKRIKAI